MIILPKIVLSNLCICFLLELVPVHLLAITGKIQKAIAGRIPHKITAIEVKSDIVDNQKAPSNLQKIIIIKKNFKTVRQEMSINCFKITNIELQI